MRGPGYGRIDEKRVADDPLGLPPVGRPHQPLGVPVAQLAPRQDVVEKAVRLVPLPPHRPVARKGDRNERSPSFLPRLKGGEKWLLVERRGQSLRPFAGGYGEANHALIQPIRRQHVADGPGNGRLVLSPADARRLDAAPQPGQGSARRKGRPP